MRFLDLFRRRSPPPDPEELRGMIFDAHARKDGARVAELCREHADLIAAHFEEWKARARDVADDERLLKRYLETLVAIATYFQRVLSRPQLAEILVPPGQTDPTEAWRDALKQAHERMEALDFEGAAGMLGDFLIDIHDFRGPVVKGYVAAANSLLGQCDFHRGRTEDAATFLERAVQLCEEADEPVNVRANLENLFEVYRYLGRATDAADAAERVATISERMGEAVPAANWRRQAAVVRSGEPLNRVVVHLGERFFEVEEAVPGPGESVELVFRRNRITLRPSHARTSEGEQKGAAGDLEGALASFREAATLDRFDPHSRYLAGVTLSYLERPSEAVECYRDAERLGPGWFNVRAYLALSRRMALGQVDPAHFKPISALLGDGLSEAAERVALADKLLEGYPDLAIVHLGRGHGLWSLERREEAVVALRRGLDCAEDEDVRTRLYLQLGLASAEPAERNALLQEAADLNGNLIAAAMATIAMRVEARSQAEENGGDSSQA